MSITNSFHSSAKKHAISTNAALSKCQRHNSRGYYSYYYDKSKIVDLTGNAEALCGDVKSFINATFSEQLESYNKNQKRNDRKINETAFEHFCNNKTLNIANEAIFQLGDNQFWEQYRQDTIIQTRRGERVLKNFPENIKGVMNELFKKQGEAYEHIYDTHGDIILKYIRDAKKHAEEFLDSLSYDESAAFSKILKLPLDERKNLIAGLPDPDKYTEYADSIDNLATIKKLKLEERIKHKQMHIKLINQVAHYDEFSPHSHGISVCWTDGYANGLKSRIAKTVVLNKWSLTVIQEHLHKIAYEEMQKHPEIFGEETLLDIQKGRNFDYSVEQLTRMHQRQLEENIEQLTETHAIVTNEINNIISDSSRTLSQMIERSIEAVLISSSHSDALFFFDLCSDAELDAICEKGHELKKKLLAEEIDITPMQNGLDALIKKIETGKTNLTWSERQEFWNFYNEESSAFWYHLPELYKSINETSKQANADKHQALRTYYDSLYIIDSTRNLFSLIFAAIKLFIAACFVEAANIKLEVLNQERRCLKRATVSFKHFCNAYREDLKKGHTPSMKYVNGIVDIIQFIDEKVEQKNRVLQHKDPPMWR